MNVNCTLYLVHILCGVDKERWPRVPEATTLLTS